jgi:1,2-diacylglycerol 3-alpha-glucosyltransferase
MNILIINPILRTADYNKIPKVETIKDCMIYNLSIGFKNLGHNVTLIAAEDYKPNKKEDYEIEVVFVKTNIKKIFLPSVLPLMFGLIRYLKANKKEYDLIISSELFSFSSLFATCICPNKTLIWHELAIHNRKFKYIPSKFWYNLVVPLFFKHIKTTPRSIDSSDFIKKFKSENITSPVEHGVNIDKFKYDTNKNKQFIIVSQLIERKNISSILYIFKSFVIKYKLFDYKLIIVGRGPLQQVLEQQIKTLGIESNVELLGFKPHDQLNTLIVDSMALLINTKQDNNMVSIPEAIVSGTPVLMNNVPTNAFIVKENNLGIVKKDWNEDDLKSIVDNNSFYVQNCIAYRQNLSIESCAQNLINAFFNENPTLQ